MQRSFIFQRPLWIEAAGPHPRLNPRLNQTKAAAVQWHLLLRFTKQMNTRSTYKCSISGITLEPSEGLSISGRIVHNQFIRSWLSTYGIECLPDGSESVPDALKEEFADVISAPKALLLKQRQFVFHELSESITRALMGTLGSNEWQKNFMYTKVLMAWYIVIDPRGALESFSNALELCQGIVDDGTPSFSHIDTLINLINTTLYSFLSDPDITTTIDIIDQQKHTGIRSVFIGSDQSLNRYLAQLSNTSPALVQYIVDQRLT